MTSSPPSVAGVVEGAAYDVLLLSSQLTRLSDGQQACNKRQKSGNRFAEICVGLPPHCPRNERYRSPILDTVVLKPGLRAAHVCSLRLLLRVEWIARALNPLLEGADATPERSGGPPDEYRDLGKSLRFMQC